MRILPCALVVLALVGCNRDEGIPSEMSAPADLTFVPCGVDRPQPPTIMTLRTPLDLMSPTVTYRNAYEGQSVSLLPAASSQLVVTSVFPSGFAIGDPSALYDPKTDTGGWNHVFVSMTPPPVGLAMGSVISRVDGLVLDTVGFTEIAPCRTPEPTDTATVPKSNVLSSTDAPRLAASSISLLRQTASTVTLTGFVCPIDQTTTTGKSWVQYNTFQLELPTSISGRPTGDCGSFSTFGISLPGKTLGSFDPLQCTPQSVSSTGCLITVTGMLKNSSGQVDDLGSAGGAPTACKTSADCVAAGLGSDPCVEGTCKKGLYDFWTILPRSASDIVVM